MVPNVRFGQAIIRCGSDWGRCSTGAGLIEWPIEGAMAVIKEAFFVFIFGALMRGEVILLEKVLGSFLGMFKRQSAYAACGEVVQPVILVVSTRPRRASSIGHSRRGKM